MLKLFPKSSGRLVSLINLKVQYVMKCSLIMQSKKCKIRNILEEEAEGKNKPKLKVDRRLALHAATSEKRWNRCFGLSFNRYNAQSQPILSLEYSMSRTCKISRLRYVGRRRRVTKGRKPGIYTLQYLMQSMCRDR
jgi:hypothetical protein